MQNCNIFGLFWLAFAIKNNYQNIMRYGYALAGDGLAQEQVAALRAAKCDAVFADVEGRLHLQAERGHMMALLAAGDMVMVTSLDRLATSLPRLLELLGELADLKVDLVTLDGAVDTREIGSGSFYAHAALLAACGRRLSVARMHEGRTQAQRRGQRLGRRPKLNDAQIEHGRKLLSLGESGRAVARTLGISEATLYRHVKEH